MKYCLIFLTTTLLLIGCKTTKKTENLVATTPVYRFEIDLVNLKDDKVSVKFSVPKNALSEGKYILPKLVPGYYNAMDFGQFITNFKAIGKNNQPISVEKLDKNSWLIHDLKNVSEISYQVDDAWETTSTRTQTAKSPASMFAKDSVFVINYNSLVGYFEELKNGIYRLDINKPKAFYGSSALNHFQLDDTSDVVNAASYRELVDAPVLYCAPDTAWINVGETRVLVSVFAKQEPHFAKTISGKLETLLRNQQAYLGGKLPVSNYAFLIYHDVAPEGNFSGDGLEHNNSTLCLFASPNLKELPEYIFDVAAHEFFHIITPLSIHSFEIQNYDYLNPVMSKHLWLYEGMTEYATMHMPIKQKVIDLKAFSFKIEDKIKQMSAFDNTLSFTEMSQKAMQRQDQYLNFYQKGALIGLCLDITLRELSSGKMGTQELTQALVLKYGKNNAFKDDELFDVITAMTYPEIRLFFKDYVENGKPLPLKSLLQRVGFDLNATKKTVQVMEKLDDKQIALRISWIGQ